MFEGFLEAVKNGMTGGNKGVPIGHSRLGEHIYIKKGIYTIIGGNSGTGKTSFMDTSYVLNPYHALSKMNSDIKVNWIYNSMERPKEFKIAKWVSIHLKRRNNILIDVPSMLGWKATGSRVDKEIYQKIKDSRKDIEPLLEQVYLHDGAMNPTGIFKRVVDYADKRGLNLKADAEKVFFHWGFGKQKKSEIIGKFNENDYIITPNGDKRLYFDVKVEKNGVVINKRIFQHHREYFPYDKKLITIIIGDHFLKLKGETSEGKLLPKGSKELLDIMSAYNGEEFRDYYNFSPVWVSQFNRGTYNTDRHDNLEPQESDFKGTGNLYDDCDVALGLFNPRKFQINSDLGYNVDKFTNQRTGHNRYRSVYLLKNSYGVDSVGAGFFFQGENGLYEELPRPNEKEKLESFYKRV